MASKPQSAGRHRAKRGKIRQFGGNKSQRAAANRAAQKKIKEKRK